MTDSMESLTNQLQPISRRIHALKNILQVTIDPEARLELDKELKQLRWQALFYIEKIENLRKQG